MQAVLFLIFTIALLFSAYALMTTDVLRIEKAPLFGRFEILFGFFETCVKSRLSLTCQAFPSPDHKCQLALPDMDKPLTFCQVWLTARTMEIGAALFGVLGWLSWLGLLVNYNSTLAILIGWCTLFYGIL